MTEFTFMLSDRTTDLLYSIKQQAGLDDLTGNEFARMLLEDELYRQFPADVKRDEQGCIINADKYRGK